MSAVVIVGAGRMGVQIACEHALHGHDVTILARSPERAEATVDATLAWLAELGLEARPTGRLTAAELSHPPAAEPELVVESIPEDLDLKVAVLAPLAASWPAATIATNTSSIPIGELGEGIAAPERTLGTHYWNPPLLMPLVELIAGPRTDADRVEAAAARLQAMGKRTIRVRRDVPGFIWNRLQAALLREALWLVENGVADTADVDEAVRAGLARRWQLTGPFETVSLGGLQTFAGIAANVFPELSTADAAPGLGRWLEDDPAVLEALAARRDRGLADALQDDAAPRPGGDPSAAESDSAAPPGD